MNPGGRSRSPDFVKHRSWLPEPSGNLCAQFFLDVLCPTVTREAAVRMYLQYLADPSSLVDADSVRTLEDAVHAATDPVEKLKAIAAKAWADSEGIPGSAFRSMGVPGDVLTRAGFGGGRRTKSPRKAGTARVGRAKSTNIGAIQAWVLASDGPFTSADVQRSVGGSAATIKKAIDALTDAGEVENLGPVTGHSARGRAPFHYQRLS
jgi:hypothetical protein